MRAGVLISMVVLREWSSLWHSSTTLMRLSECGGVDRNPMPGHWIGSSGIGLNLPLLVQSLLADVAPLEHLLGRRRPCSSWDSRRSALIIST